MFRILVEADYAIFTRPEMKVERVTYPVPTPSALEGMLKSVYWKPAIRYVIDKIVVFNPIVYASIRRNEVKNKVLLSAVKSQMDGKNGDPTIYTNDFKIVDGKVKNITISQRASLMLKNVKYGIEFHFELTHAHCEREENGNAKHYEIIKRRIENGQCFRQPCMGCRELAVKSITLVEDFDYSAVDATLKNTQDLGYMLYGLKFADDEELKKVWDAQYFSDSAEAEFYHPFMVDGIIDVQKCRRGEYDFIKPV